MTIKDIINLTDEQKKTITIEDLKEYIETNSKDMVFLMIVLINNPILLIYFDYKFARRCLDAMKINKLEYTEVFNYLIKDLDDNGKLKEINTIGDSYIRAILTMFLEDDNIKMKEITKYSELLEVSVIAQSLKDDRLIEELITHIKVYFKKVNSINHINLFYNLIISFNDDSYKEKYLRYVADPYKRMVIINSFNSNELKVKYLKESIEEAQAKLKSKNK